MNFVTKTDFAAPYAARTNNPHNPIQYRRRRFKKGEIISGVIGESSANGKPSFMVHKGSVVVPLDLVKQVVTKEVTGKSNAEGEKENKPTTITEKSKTFLSSKSYTDALIVGGLLGFGGAYYAETKGWLPEATNKNKIIGAVVGAILSAYLVYRFKK